MPQIINSFNAGELTPRLVGRVDWIPKYPSGCKQLENFVVQTHGGAQRRPGTKHVANVKTMSGRVRLIPFIFSTSISYLLEFGENYIRFIRDGVQIESASVPFEITTTYLKSELRDLRFAPSADVMYITAPNHLPAKLARMADDDWTLTDVEFTGGPFLPENDTDTTLTPSYDIWTDDRDYLKDDVVAIDDTPVSISGKEFVPTGVGLQELFFITAHGFGTGDIAIIDGTDDNNGLNIVRSGSTTLELLFQQRDAQLETAGANATLTKRTHFRAIDTHTSNADAPPASTTHWRPAVVFGGTNMHLTSSAALFESGHVGALFKTSYVRTEFVIDDSFSSVTAGDPIPVFGGWSFSTNGFWEGTIVIQRSSEPNGTDFKAIRTFKSVNDRNVVATGEETEVNVLYRVAMTVHVSGTVDWDFSPDETILDGIVKVTELVTDTEVIVTVVSAVPAVTATKTWREGSWSVKRGYPRTTIFHEERLLLAGTAHQPITIWGSKTNNFETFKLGTNDNDSFELTLSSDRQNRIEWMDSQESLIIGTSGAEWRLGAANQQDPLTPTNAVARRQSMNGSANLQSMFIDDSVLFMQRTGRKLRELSFDFDRDGFVSPDISLNSEHITESGIVEWAYAEHNEKILYLVRSDGVLLSFTYNRLQEVFAWARQTTDGLYESVAVIPSTTEDQVYVSVKRTVNGAEERHIELLQLLAYTGKDDAHFLDDALSYDGGSVKVITTITNASPGVVFSAAHELINDNHVRISGVSGMTEINDTWKVVKITDDTFSLKVAGGSTAVDTTAFGTFISFTAPGAEVAVTDISTATEAVVTTAAAHNLSEGLRVAVVDQVGMPELGRTAFFAVLIDTTSFKIKRQTDNKFIDSTFFDPYVSGGTSAPVPQALKVENTFAGLGHLEAKLVKIVGDTAISPSKIVASGTVTANEYFNKAIIGLGYSSVLEPMHPENQTGQSQGIKSRINKLGLQLYKSGQFDIGPTASTLANQSLRTALMTMDDSPDLLTGYKEVNFPNGYFDTNPIVISTDKPLPLTILSMIIDITSTKL